MFKVRKKIKGFLLIELLGAFLLVLSFIAFMGFYWNLISLRYKNVCSCLQMLAFIADQPHYDHCDNKKYEIQEIAKDKLFIRSTSSFLQNLPLLCHQKLVIKDGKNSENRIIVDSIRIHNATI